MVGAGVPVRRKMNHNTKVYELIQEFPKIIPDEYCNILIKWFILNEHLHQEGQVYGGHATGDDFANAIVLDKKKTTQAYPDKDDPISDVMTKIIQTAYGKYSEMHPTPISQPMSVRDYSIRVYNKGDGYFKKHCDQTAGANVHRVFGFIGYLNDVEEGGGTEFEKLGVYVKAEKGKVVIFPCNSLFEHEGTVPVSGDKYVMTCFINYTDILNEHDQ